MIRFLISIPEELRNILRTEASVRGQTVTGVIREILWDWVEANRKHERQT